MEGVVPLCANNKVSRAGLHTGPVPVATPAFTPAQHPSPSLAQAAIHDAAAQIEQSTKSVLTATRGQLTDMLRAAQQEVDRARRTPHAPKALANLERALGRLRREIDKRENELDAHERATGTTQRRTTARIDRLAAVNLGMGPGGATAAAPTPPPLADIDRAIDEAKRAAEGTSLDELSRAKKAAQRAVSAALKSGSPDDRIAHLKEAVKKIQRAESRMLHGDRSRPANEPVMRTEALQGPHVAYKHLKPTTCYQYGDQEYFTDENGLPSRARGYLSTTGDERSYRATEIGQLGIEGDVGFHLIARQFGGHPSGPNIVPANVKLNSAGRQAYGSLENTWRTLQRAGARVYVDVNLVGPATRPSMITIDFWVEVENQDDFLSTFKEDERESFRGFLTTSADQLSGPNSIAFENVAP